MNLLFSGNQEVNSNTQQRVAFITVVFLNCPGGTEQLWTDSLKLSRLLGILEIFYMDSESGQLFM